MLKLPSNIPPLYSTQNVDSDEKVMHARLFALGSAATWLVAEYDPQDKIAFGYANLGNPQEAEWGYVSIDELEELKFMGIPQVEVDAHFTPKPFKDCISPNGTI